MFFDYPELRITTCRISAPRGEAKASTVFGAGGLLLKLGRSLWVPMVAVAASAFLTLGQVGAASGPQASTLSKGTLNTSIWTQVLGQDSGLSMTKHAGWLSIPTEHAPVGAFASTLHNMVLQPVSPSANWTVSVETTFFGVKFGPQGTLPNYQGGGIYAWQNDTSWVRMIREPADCKLGLQYYSSTFQQPATWTTDSTAVVCNNSYDPLWIRLSKQGDVYTGYYSVDGSNWVQAGPTETVSTLSPADIGLNAGEGGGTGTPTDMGFKDFAVGATGKVVQPPSSTSSSSSSSGATTSKASSTTSSTASSSASSTATSSSSAGSTSIPKTGSGPLPFMAGLILTLAGFWQLRALRQTHS